MNARRFRPDARGSPAEHLALAPVAFAITTGPEHALAYSNARFRTLQRTPGVYFGETTPRHSEGSIDLTALLDGVFRVGRAVRNVSLRSGDQRLSRWHATVWPVYGAHGRPMKLVIELRDGGLDEAGRTRQQTILERLILSALREQDAAREAAIASTNARFLADVSHDLAMSLDYQATCETVSRVGLPRTDSWCIVDLVDANGGVRRLPISHPDASKRALTARLETIAPAGPGAVSMRQPRKAHARGEPREKLRGLRHPGGQAALLDEIGCGSRVSYPLIVHGRVQGEMMFIGAAGESPFTPEERILAGEVAGRCAVALDNARLFHEAEELRSAAQAANRAKVRFLGGMSHELRTPLNVIGGFVDLIAMGLHGPVTEEQAAALVRIKANQLQLLVLITDILNFAQVETGGITYRSTAVPLTVTLAAVVEVLDTNIRNGVVTLDGPNEDSEAVAWADPARVQQILTNLVTNALKYASRAGGTITLRCGRSHDAVVASVADTGPGIPSEKLESIFEPFVQLGPAREGRRDGVGLGLAISRDLARAMGGDLVVESTVGVGSCFTLTLPGAQTPARDP